MTATEILKTYLCASFLLFAAYGGFVFLQRLTRHLGGPSHRQWVLIAQALVTLALLAPLGARQLPNRHLAAFSALAPAREGRIIQLRKVLPRVVPTASVPLVSEVRHSQRRAPQFSTLLLLALSLGALVQLFRAGRSIARLRAIVANAASLRALGQVRVVLSPEVSIPFSYWFGGASWVVLPERLLGNSRDLKLAILHEFQHHRQGDTRWAALYELVICAFFAHPMIYLWKKKVTELQEFSCDEALVGRRGVSAHDYGSCLVRVAEAAFGSRHAHVGTTCMATASKNPVYFKSFLRRRVEMFMNRPIGTVRKWMGPLAGTLAACATIAASMAAERALRPDSTRGIANAGTAVMDPVIQKIAEADLKEAIQSEKAGSGFAIVAEPGSGRILAVANFDQPGTLGHWALSQVFGPASIAKTLVAAEAMNRGLASPDEFFPGNNGSYLYGDHVYHDWKKEGWASLTLTQAMAQSSDICMIHVAERLGAPSLVRMLEDYGIGPGGVTENFPEAVAGVLPKPEDPRHPTIVPGVAEGFGYLASPLEIVQSYGAIANGGRLMKPAQADAIGGQMIRRVVSEEIAAKTRELLRQVVLTGTAKKAQSKLYSTAGKTASAARSGTIEWNGSGDQKSDFAGFVGFAPVDHPQVEVYVGIFDPKTASGDGAHGGEHAAPVFKRIAEDVLRQWNVAPDMN
jgi:hypothetical protein